METLTLRTLEQKVLFEHELKGQISDGYWENTRPYNHWILPCRCEVIIGKDVGRNFDTSKTNYNFSSSELIECVGERMIRIVKLARAFGIINLSYLSVLQDNGDVPEYVYHAITRDDSYYIQALECIEKFGLAFIKQVLSEDSYTERDLKKDLKEIKKAFKIKKEE